MNDKNQISAKALWWIMFEKQAFMFCAFNTKVQALKSKDEKKTKGENFQ